MELFVPFSGEAFENLLELAGVVCSIFRGGHQDL
jgi:hypothetical protein